VQRYAKHLLDPLLEIGAPPPHHAIFLSLGTFLDKRGELGFLLCRQPGWAARRLAVFKPRRPSYL
jgi:hypothetical protein